MENMEREYNGRWLDSMTGSLNKKIYIVNM